MNDKIENGMLFPGPAPDYRETPYHTPCRYCAPSFRAWILESFSFNGFLDYEEIMESAIKRLGARYQQEMKAEGYRNIEELIAREK